MKKTIISFLVSISCSLCHAQQSPRDILIFNQIKQNIVGNTSMNIPNHIYFDMDLQVKNSICLKHESDNQAVAWVDEEGGSVIRFKEPWELDSPHNQEKLPLAEFKKKTDDVASHLKKYCVSVNLGVLGDTYDDKKETIYHGRSYSSNPVLVNEYASAYADSLRKAGILAGWKHFPGHTENIHVDKSNPAFKPGAWEQSVDTSPKEEILARMKAFDNHGKHDILMISQTIYPAISNRPAVLSPEIVRLAHKIQPNSLLMTDDLTELNLTDDDMIFLFKNYDYWMFLDGRVATKFVIVIIRAVDDGRISEKELSDKFSKK